MGKLVKAGADARHFMLQFRSVQKMAEMVSELSGLEAEGASLTKARDGLQAEIEKLKPRAEGLKKKVKASEAAGLAAEASAARLTQKAEKQAAALIAGASNELKLEAAHDSAALKALREEWAQERVAFDHWRVRAEAEKTKITADTETLQAALTALRAKLL